MKRRQSSLFKRLLSFLILTCILTACLSVLIIGITSANAYARRIADEMTPRAHAVSRLASRYLTNQISYDTMLDIALREQQSAQTYIIDSTGSLIISSSSENAGGDSSFDSTLKRCAIEILNSGETKTWISWNKHNGIIVGTPIYDNMMRASGVVIMTKRTIDVFSSMLGLELIIMVSCLFASALMIIPAYFGSKRIISPIRQMTDVSIKMASGDFSARAEENVSSAEIAQLGAALNHLSAELCRNIDDLILAQKRLHLILNGLHEGVIAIDADLRATYCNQAAMTLYQADTPEILAARLPDIAELCASAAKSGEPCSLLTDYGEKKLLLVASSSPENSEARPGTIVVIQDVTASERLEQTRRDYVANVSHELRTPIASIRSLAETLNDGLVKSEDDRSRYYGYILRESLRLSRLINDLLELSRLQSGAVALEKKSFDLCELLTEVSERMSITAGYSGISVQLGIGPDDVLPVYSNPDRIEQALIALMDNAIKFAADDGLIRLEVEREAERVWVLVRNTGHIAEADLPHLFERFYKADSSHTDTGTGLGLAIVSEVLTLLGEKISAENDGEFVTFRFTVALDHTRS